MTRRSVALLLLMLGLRLDLVGRPFVQYFSNREVQNAIPIRMMQEGQYAFWDLPNKFTDSYGIAEFQLIPLLLRVPYAALEAVGLAHLPKPGDAEAARLYYWQIAMLGRLWSLGMALGTLWLLHRLLRRAWSQSAADLALLLYALLPYNRFHDQIFIAEPTIMFLATLGMALLWSWSETREAGSAHLAGAALAFALVLLLKVSHIFIGLPIAFLLFRRWRGRALLRPELWLFGVAVLLPAALFYKVGFGGSVEDLDSMAWDNTKAILLDWAGTRDNGLKYLARHLWSIWTPLGAPLLALGLWHGLRREPGPARDLGRLLAIWLASWAYYWFMAGGLSGHFYYQAPSVAVAAAILALGAEPLGRRLPRRLGLAALALLAVFLLGWNGVIQRWNDEGSRHWRGNWCRTIYAAGLEADARLPKDAKIVAGCRGAIQFMVFYYVHRDGFSLKVEDTDQDQAAAPARLEEMREGGATFYVAPFNYDGPKHNGVVFDRQTFESLPIATYLAEHYLLLAEAPDWLIYDLRSRSGAPLAP